MMIRTYDQLYSLMHYGNMLSVFDASFSLSNETLSFNLIKQIGFWDTCSMAIADDAHIILKAFWKTQGQI